MRSPVRVLALVAALAAALALAGCDGGTSVGMQPSPPTPTLAVAVAPGAVTVAQGRQVPITVTLTRGGGFAGDAALAVTGAPAGLTAGLAPLVVPGAVATSTVTVSAAADLAPGTYALALTGAGRGVATATAPLSVTVTPAAPEAAPSVTLAVAPAPLVVIQGATGTTTVTLARTGFTGAVAIGTSGAPAGVTVTAPAPAAGDDATLSVAVAGVAVPGDYPITVRGTAAGVAGASTTFTLRVAPGGTLVRLTFCAPLPVWAAVQDGTGGWTRVHPVAGHDTYEFRMGARGGLAVVTPVGTRRELQVAFATPAELPGVARLSCTTYGSGTRTLHGSVRGLAFGATEVQAAAIAVGPGTTTAVAGGDTTIRLDSLPPGPLTLLAGRSAFSLATGASLGVDRLILRRDVTLADGATLPALDFDGAEAFAPATAQLTVGDLGADTATAFAAFNAGPLGGGYFSFAQGRSPLTVAAVPAARLQANELHMVGVAATARNDATQLRAAFTFAREVVARTVALGPYLSAPSVTTSGGAYLRPRLQLPRQAAYGAWVLVDYAQDGATAREASVGASAAWLGDAGSWDLALPDLSGVDGFDPAWGLQPGVATSWSVAAYAGDVGTLLGGAAHEGDRFASASRDGTITAGGAVQAGLRAPAFARHAVPAAAPAVAPALQRWLARGARLGRLTPHR